MKDTLDLKGLAYGVFRKGQPPHPWGYHTVTRRVWVGLWWSGCKCRLSEAWEGHPARLAGVEVRDIVRQWRYELTL